MSRTWEPYGNADRRKRKMSRIDALPSDLRRAVHEVGWLMVKEFMEAGITDGKTIVRLVKMAQHECTIGRLQRAS